MAASSTASHINNFMAKGKRDRAIVVEDLPSDISEDEWGEIQKFGQRLHEEQKRKQKEDAQQKVKKVREVLEQ